MKTVLLLMLLPPTAYADIQSPMASGHTYVAGVVYWKALPEGRTLSVSRTKLPPDPKTIKSIDDFAKAAEATKGFPKGGTPLYPNYSWLYSFTITKGREKPKTLWTLRADHLLNPLANDDNIEMDWSVVRMKDAAVEGQVLVLVVKQMQNTFGFIILPDAKNGPQRLPRSGPSFRLGVDKDDEHGRVFMRVAQITGSFLKGTLAVNLTYTDGKHERFDWKDSRWVKQDSITTQPAATEPLTGITSSKP